MSHASTDRLTAALTATSGIIDALRLLGDAWAEGQEINGLDLIMIMQRAEGVERNLFLMQQETRV